MFCDVTTATSHRNKFPKLKGRAAEIREVIPCLLDVWNEVANMECAHHMQVRTLLQCSCEMERIVDAHKNEDVWSTDVADQFKAYMKANPYPPVLLFFRLVGCGALFKNK